MEQIELREALVAFNLLQSENYDGAAHDLVPAQEHIRQVLSNFTLERGLVRLAVECAPDVRSLRNKLDNSANYGRNADKKLEQAMAMRQDVLTLMERRNAEAKAMAFPGYDAMVLAADGISTGWLKSELQTYLDRHLTTVAHRVKAERLSMDEWFSWIKHLGALSKTYEPLPLIEAFEKRLGLKDILPCLDVQVTDSFCFASQTQTSIHMQVSPVKDADSWTTLFHEFGHAYVYASIPENDLPWLSPLVDEVIAVLYENAAIRLLAEEPLRTCALNLRHIEYTRTCISGLFELALWQDRSDPESLYEQWYSRLGLHVDPAMWSLDSFRSIDPMTIFAYTVGQSLADALPDEKFIPILQELSPQAADITLFDLVGKIKQTIKEQVKLPV